MNIEHKSDLEINLDGAMAIVSLMPHAIQARLKIMNSDETVWSLLKDEAMVVSSADMVLKHGPAIAGTWAMLGILDALPEVDDNAVTDSGLDTMIQGFQIDDNPFGSMMTQMMPYLRPLLGRPLTAYGMTPLMIFREVSL